jgi:intracellular sulfur oxidation DsrE/DsrF family protein
MKRTLAVLAVVSIAALSAGFSTRHPEDYKVAFDLTSRDTLDQKAVLRWIKEITTANPQAEIEVVMYGAGFELVMPERSKFIPEVEAAMRNRNVEFKVCETSLRNGLVSKEKLLARVETVPDGIHELVEKQQETWGYIKVGH